MTFGKLDSSYTRSISAVFSKSPDNIVFDEGLGLFLVCVHFCSSTFFWALHIVCVQNILMQLQRRIKPPLHRMSLTGNFEKEMGQCCINTVNSQFFCFFLHPLIHSLKATETNSCHAKVMSCINSLSYKTLTLSYAIMKQIPSKTTMPNSWILEHSKKLTFNKIP